MRVWRKRIWIKRSLRNESLENMRLERESGDVKREITELTGL